MKMKTQSREFMEHVMTTDPLEMAIDWISDNLSPEDVFDKKTLDQWAIDSGYTKPQKGSGERCN